MFTWEMFLNYLLMLTLGEEWTPDLSLAQADLASLVVLTVWICTK